MKQASATGGHPKRSCDAAPTRAAWRIFDRNARDKGILKNSAEQGRQILEKFFHLLGFETVDIIIPKAAEGLGREVRSILVSLILPPRAGMLAAGEMAIQNEYDK